MMIRAPWSAVQVLALNRWQNLGHMHEFNCPYHPKLNRVLVAKSDGWHCPTCAYRQDWAHDFMLDISKHPKPPFV